MSHNPYSHALGSDHRAGVSLGQLCARRPYRKRPKTSRRSANCQKGRHFAACSMSQCICECHRSGN